MSEFSDRAHIVENQDDAEAKKQLQLSYARGLVQILTALKQEWQPDEGYTLESNISVAKTFLDDLLHQENPSFVFGVLGWVRSLLNINVLDTEVGQRLNFFINQQVKKINDIPRF